LQGSSSTAPFIASSGTTSSMPHAMPYGSMNARFRPMYGQHPYQYQLQQPSLPPSNLAALKPFIGTGTNTGTGAGGTSSSVAASVAAAGAPTSGDNSEELSPTLTAALAPSGSAPVAAASSSNNGSNGGSSGQGTPRVITPSQLVQHNMLQRQQQQLQATAATGGSASASESVAANGEGTSTAGDTTGFGVQPGSATTLRGYMQLPPGGTGSRKPLTPGSITNTASGVPQFGRPRQGSFGASSAY
jgi:hypothetical protein